MDDTILVKQTTEHFKQVLDTKIIGAWNLHELSLGNDLDFFVMFSSMASMVGSIAQANYVSANAFLDSLAYYRKSNNLPALCINWGIWTDVGMAVRIGSDKRERRAQGIGVIKPTQGVKVFDKVMRTDLTQIGIIPINWTEFVTTGALSHVDNFMLEFATMEVERQKMLNSDSSNKQILNQLKLLNEVEKKVFLIHYLQELGSKVMGLQVSEIDPFKPMNQIGLDSLMSIELKNKIKMELDLDINVVKFMEGISMDELATEFASEINKLNDTVVLEKPIDLTMPKLKITESLALDDVTDVLVNVDDLSDSELDKMLKEMSN
jgi:hypothetical protein